MEPEIVKGKPLTKIETKFLLDLIEGSTVINTKTSKASNNKLKTEEWMRLTDKFNAKVPHSPRTPQQLRMKWENLKKNSRKRSTRIRMNDIVKTNGGGPIDYIPPDDILDRVTCILGSKISEFTVPYEGDIEPVELFVADCDGLNEGENSVNCDIEDTKESVVDISETTIAMPFPPIDHNVVTPNTPKRLTFSPRRTVKKKFKTDKSRTARNNAIAEYYFCKKKILDIKFNYINLEAENMKLKNLELNLNNEKLQIEISKLKLELENLRNQQLLTVRNK